MKIAMVSEHASPLATLGGVDAGGQNVHVAELARALAARGHEVVVYTRRDDVSLPEQAELCPGVVVEHLDAGPPEPVAKDDFVPLLPAMARQLINRSRAFGPDVLHAHFWMSGLLAREAAAAQGTAWIQTFHALGIVKRRHQGDADTSPAHRVGDEAGLARTATRLTASCTDELRELVAMGAPRSRVDVIPSGVDLELFRPDGPAAARTRRPRILSVGRLVARKGVDDVIRALPHLPGEVELVIAGGPDVLQLGSDPEARRLLALAGDLGVQRQVRLVGQTPHAELPALIRSADVVACLPWYEPFGIVPLEAMACGVPVVGTAVGGLLDTVVDDVTGLLVPPREPAAVADALARVLADPELRTAFGRAGADRMQHYRWSEIAAATERTYLHAALEASAPCVRPGRQVVMG